MCGRFFRHGVSWDEYREALGILVPDHVDPPEPAYNVAPTQIVPIVRLAVEGDDMPTGARQLAPARWGLIPSWWSKPITELKAPAFNASADSVEEKPFFRGAFRHRRCLIPMSGFYQWTGAKGSRTPFAIALRNQRWFCVAGLWDRAMIDGSEIDSFTLLTTTPNDLMAGLHTTMPVILHRQDHERWLDTTAPVDGLFEPFETDAMQAWPVRPDVGNVRNQGPQLIEEA